MALATVPKYRVLNINQKHVFLKPCTSSYAEDTPFRMLGKLKKMDYELLRDVFMKVQSVQHIRRMYYKHSIFQQGETIFSIRTLYKRMIYYYHRTIEAKEEKPMVRMKYMNMVQKYKVTIDKHIQMSEMYERAAATWSSRKDHVEDVLRSRKEVARKRAELQKAALRANMKKIRSRHGPVVERRKQAEYGFESEGENSEKMF